MLRHILQSALSIGVDLAFVFSALLLAQKQSPASGARTVVLVPAMEDASPRKMGATATTLPTCHLAMLEEPKKGSRGD